MGYYFATVFWAFFRMSGWAIHAACFLAGRLSVALGGFSSFINNCRRRLEVDLYKAKKEKGKEGDPVKRTGMEMGIPDKQNVVGKTKTEFILELPKMVTREPEPVHSQPLEKETVPGLYEEPGINQEDVEVEEKSLRDIIAEENGLLMEYATDNDPDGFSSSVTLEELTETYKTLRSKKTTREEERKASEVLIGIEGTALGNFFLLESECMEKAKKLMEMGTKTGNEQACEAGIPKFDIDRFV